MTLKYGYSLFSFCYPSHTCFFPLLGLGEWRTQNKNIGITLFLLILWSNIYIKNNKSQSVALEWTVDNSKHQDTYFCSIYFSRGIIWSRKAEICAIYVWEWRVTGGATGARHGTILTMVPGRHLCICRNVSGRINEYSICPMLS